MTNKEITESSNNSKVQEQRKGGVLKPLVMLPVLAAGTWIAYSQFGIDHDVPLPEAIPARRIVYPAKTAANVNYYFAEEAEGRPLVLVHSINAAASAYEMEPLFRYYRSERPVYALDLPGFGFSDRPERVYSAQYYTETILDFLERRIDTPADVVALSLSSEFVARAALAMPELFNSVTFISPTGLGKREEVRKSQQVGMTGGGESVYSWLSFPLWRQALFDLIATRRSIVRFLGQSFVGPIPPGFVDYAYATSHQPGAKNAPLYFVSGRLFTPNVRQRVYEKLSVPTLILYDRDPFTGFEALPKLVEHNAHIRETRIVPSLGLPHYEKLPETTRALESFWQSL